MPKNEAVGPSKVFEMTNPQFLLCLDSWNDHMDAIDASNIIWVGTMRKQSEKGMGMAAMVAAVAVAAAIAAAEATILYLSLRERSSKLLEKEIASAESISYNRR